MNSNDSLRQYTDLFLAHREAIDARAPEAFNRLRPAALERLEKAGRLPRRGDEGYARTDIGALFAPDFGVNIMRVPAPVDLAASLRCDVPNISTLMGVVAGDSFRPTATLLRNLPAGVEFMSLAEAARTQPALVERFLGRLSAKGDIPTQLNTLLAQDGVLLHVAAGVKCDKPLQLINIANAGIASMAVRRLLVVLDEGAEACLLSCDHSQRADVDYLNSQVAEIYLAPGARLDFYEMEESSPRTARVAATYASLQAGARLTANTSTICGGHTRNAYTVELCGEGAEAAIAGMVVGSDSQHTDNSTLVVHHAPRCSSSQLFKYILDDSASGAFQGLIRVDTGAVFTEAHQTNRNLLASDSATMHTEPQLEIYCDEVKCGHGATTGQLDAAALFYMRTRGIPEAEARMMLMQAFMADVIDTIALAPLHERLRMIVERRLSGQPAACSDCAAACTHKQ